MFPWRDGVDPPGRHQQPPSPAAAAAAAHLPHSSPLTPLTNNKVTSVIVYTFIVCDNDAFAQWFYLSI